MNYRIKLPVKAFWLIMRPFVKAWMFFVMHPQIINNIPVDLKPPYLLISNHVNVYDGLIVTLYSKHLPVAIFDDVQRLNWFNRFIFTSMGVVFKAFGIADPMSIRSMLKAREAGRVMLLYPEGEITWTGDSKPLEMNFARLVKLLSIPVVLAKAKGAYTKQPKWAKSFRSGKSIFEYSLLLSAERISQLNEGQLLEFLQMEHKHNELDWLETDEGKACRFHTPNPAKSLEHLLFCCPQCHGTNSMATSEADAIACSHCGYTAAIDANLILKAKGNELIIGDVRSWAKWQRGYWSEIIKDKVLAGGDILRAECPSVKTAPIRGRKALSIGHGPAVLRQDGIYFKLASGEETKIALEDIRVCHCYRFAPNQDNRLLIRTAKRYFILELTEPNCPTLSWELAVKDIQELSRQDVAKSS